MAAAKLNLTGHGHRSRLLNAAGSSGQSPLGHDDAIDSALARRFALKLAWRGLGTGWRNHGAGWIKGARSDPRGWPGTVGRELFGDEDVRLRTGIG